MDLALGTISQMRCCQLVRVLRGSTFYWSLESTANGEPLRTKLLVEPISISDSCGCSLTLSWKFDSRLRCSQRGSLVREKLRTLGSRIGSSLECSVRLSGKYERKRTNEKKKRRTGGQSGVVGGETRIGRAGAVPGAVRRPRVGQGDAVGRRQVGGAVDVLGAAGEAAGRRVRRGHAVRPRRRHGAAHLDVVALRWWPVAGVAAAAEQQEGVGVGGDGGGVQRAQDVVDGKGGRFQFGTGGHVDRTAHGRRGDRHDR